MNINATLIGQSIAFAVFVWFCMKYVWPPIMQNLNARKKQIADGLTAAARGKEELEVAQLKATEQLQGAREQAQEIIDLANKRAGQIVDEAKEHAKEEAERVKAAAQADIEQELNRAREALRAQVAVLAVTGAERILGKNLDESANSRLVDDLVAEL
ncbi:F0F1 ATP synthase subunit B [Endozoicomonas gorgoniicola]|uniref:ATP synthase subunit b n=1 Tax=Endozoicomonas gorgoniicola TaxID=1234144 RepID=A0ABT3N246_9GAMM|nr:F0F1 ATP synthase subunit B [Endozoicomonas gorgoniicola]MCW7555403.1 F0F1 ATP synthase subunit B [Endozoicomonas gorgoniicola]